MDVQCEESSNIKEMFVEQGRVIMCDRDEWRAAASA